MTRPPRALIPLALVLFGLWLLSGCIYIPMFGRTIQGTDVANKVGDGNSSRPLRTGQSTRQDIIRVLGQPTAEKPDGSALAYGWRVQNGFTVWPLCFLAGKVGYSVDGQRMLVLRLDERGTLKSFEILKHNDPWLQLMSAYRRGLLPPDFYPQPRKPSSGPYQQPGFKS